MSDDKQREDAYILGEIARDIGMLPDEEGFLESAKEWVSFCEDTVRQLSKPAQQNDKKPRFTEFYAELREIMEAFCQDAKDDLNDDLYNIEVLDHYNLTDDDLKRQISERKKEYKILVLDKENEVRKELCKKYNITYRYSSNEFSWMRL